MVVIVEAVVGIVEIVEIAGKGNVAEDVADDQMATRAPSMLATRPLSPRCRHNENSSLPSCGTPRSK